MAKKTRREREWRTGADSADAAESRGGEGGRAPRSEPSRPTQRRLDPYRILLDGANCPAMRVDGVVYATEALAGAGLEDGAIQQVANVAHLPGIVGRSMGMPDIHFGYGFPIGGVAAFRTRDGVVSPGGVGYDINCGVRLVRTDLALSEVKGRIDDLLTECFRSVPAGLGGGGGIGLTERTLGEVCRLGSRWAVRAGHGWAEDVEATEGQGCLDWADPDAVSERAKKRGIDQLGTLGSGNHFLEIQAVEEIVEPETAAGFGIREPGQITVMIHCGSRGFGHQVCDDFIALMQRAIAKYDIAIPDRQLGCAPVRSPEGEKYLAAMACAANYAWANRQIIMQRVREAFERVLGASARTLGMQLVYDVAHNIAKIERHTVEGKEEELCVHRKGATRAFPAGHPDVPRAYRALGQPVIVPGDMGRASWLLVGTEKAMADTFGSTCHGAGRRLSRSAAKALKSGRQVIDDLAQQGIRVMAHSAAGAAEEQPAAYKDVSDVVEAAAGAGLSRPVARMRPLAVIKG